MEANLFASRRPGRSDYQLLLRSEVRRKTAGLKCRQHFGHVAPMSLRSEGRTFGNLLIEVALIAVGVFLALWANNWHENHEHRAQARAALRNFLGEMEANRQAMQNNRQYHETLARELDQFLGSKEPTAGDRFNRQVHFEGMRPVVFE